MTDQQLFTDYAARILASPQTEAGREQNRRAVRERAHQFTDRIWVEALLALTGDPHARLRELLDVADAPGLNAEQVREVRALHLALTGEDTDHDRFDATIVLLDLADRS